MDRLSKERRSWNMSRIRAKDTRPELLVRAALHRMGYRFRLHVSDLPGVPDILLPKYKAAIFIHGCFWHGHSDCKAASIPKTRPEFWQDKISDNKSRDRSMISALHEKGWRTAVVWECALRNVATTARTIESLGKWIDCGPSNLEVSQDDE